MKTFTNKFIPYIHNSPLLVILVVASTLLSGCIKEPSFLNNAKLSFSTDTIYFDTIFTRKPGSTYPISVTKLLSIKNSENQWVKANFNLNGGKNSPFKINIDGIAGPNIQDIEIAPNDSVFMFVQCALEANNLTLPSLVIDSLTATVGSKSEKLILAAYGWDAHYIKDSILPNNGQWNDKTKPYVIVGNAFIAPNENFTIKEGVQIFASAQTVIYVLGNLNMEGSKDARIKIRGDKPVFQTTLYPNQWGGIYFAPGAKGNISYTDITNATIGLRADSSNLDHSFNLVLKQSKIQYCGQACLAGFNGSIFAENCLFADAGSYTFLALLGGDYAFNNCTFAEFSYFNSRQEGHVAITNTLRDGNGVLLNSKELNANFTNNIIWGYLTDEIIIDKVTNSPFLLTSLSNVLKTKNSQAVFDQAKNIFNKNPRFIDINTNTYTIDSLSSAYQSADIFTASKFDILGIPRKIKPDIGGFEKP